MRPDNSGRTKPPTHTSTCVLAAMGDGGVEFC